jgi:hypothetical protein
MNLYATITSERAMKGQGGNEYVKAIVRNEKQQCIAYITFKPDDTCHIEVIKDIKTNVEVVEWIGTNDDTRGKSQKGEILPFHNHNGCYNQDCAECRKLNGD